MLRLEIIKEILYFLQKNIKRLQNGIIFHLISISYNSALNITPKDPDFLLNKGNTLYYISEFKQSISWYNLLQFYFIINFSYDLAIIENPNFAEIYNNKGNALD